MKILGYKIIEYLTTCDNCYTMLSFNEEDKTRGGFLNSKWGFICPTCGKFQPLALCAKHLVRQAPPLEK